MAYEPKSLRAAAFTDGWTLWRYRTPDAAPDLNSNYFGRAWACLRRNDHIICTWGEGSRNEVNVTERVTIAGADFIETEIFAG